MSNESPKGPAWYVAHTYSGYENKVKANLEKTVENRGFQDIIQEVAIPVEEVIEIKNGKRRSIPRKIFPGYVMVKMIMTDESWYIVRNTRGCTGFVGPASKPEPLSEEEVAKLGVDNGVAAPEVDYAVGDNVEITSGTMEGSIGTVEEINLDERKVRIKINMFGREIPAELGLHEVKLL